VGLPVEMLSSLSNVFVITKSDTSNASMVMVWTAFRLKTTSSQTAVFILNLKKERIRRRKEIFSLEENHEKCLFVNVTSVCYLCLLAKVQ